MLDFIENVILTERSMREYPGFAIITTSGTINIPMLLLTEDEKPDLYMISRLIKLLPSGEFISNDCIDKKIDPPIKLDLSFFDPENDRYYDSVLISVLNGAPPSDLITALQKMAPEKYIELCKELIEV